LIEKYSWKLNYKLPSEGIFFDRGNEIVGGQTKCRSTVTVSFPSKNLPERE